MGDLIKNREVMVTRELVKTDRNPLLKRRLRKFRRLSPELGQFRPPNENPQWRAFVRQRPQRALRGDFGGVEQLFLVEIVERDRLEIEYAADRNAGAHGRMIGHRRSQMPSG
jgi:hypothetical protein